jgi:hypothetical protein
VGQRRSPRSYKRPGPTREPYDFVAIVCEGTKSEPGYFSGLRLAYRLSSTNIRITPADGTDPLSVVTHGETLLGSEGYDRVYCVFDRDGHATYDAALERLRTCQAGRDGRVIGVPSWPCFEVWLLLHFRYSSAGFASAGKKSACDRAVAELRQHIHGYEKGRNDIFTLVEKQLADALRNATRLEQDNRRSGATNPATRVHRLVSYLQNLKAG